MEIFGQLFYKVLPIYLNIALGYLAGRFLNVDREAIAKIIFFIIAPIIIFNGILSTKMDTNILMLPITVFLISTTMCYIVYRFSKLIWKDHLANLAAFSAGAANVGYFGLPVAILLFNDQGEGIYIMSILGISFFENSVGYYMMARGTYSGRECAAKLARLPTLYAFVFGLSLNFLGVKSPDVVFELAQYCKGAFTVLGMMIIGLGLASMTKFSLDFKFIGVTFLARFVLWPIAIFMVIMADKYASHNFDCEICKALVLIASLPLAANTVVLASIFKNNPDKAATAVLLSTLFAMVYIPLVSTWYLAH